MLSPASEPRCLHDVLLLIRQRPAMYLGKKSLAALSQVASGYRLACWVHSIPEDDALGGSGLPSRFHQWLTTEKSLGEGARCPFQDLIECTGDDALAFDRFFELLDEYEALRRPE